LVSVAKSLAKEDIERHRRIEIQGHRTQESKLAIFEKVSSPN
jgi:hypothetical protein